MHEPAGIRDWLIIPAIGIVVGLVLIPLAILVDILHGDRYVYGDLGFAYLYSRVFLSIAFYVYVWITGVRFFRKRSTAPRSVIFLNIGNFAISLLLFIVGTIARESDQLRMSGIDLLVQNNFLSAGIAALIWIPYFQSSKRVKATFVSMI